MTINSHRQAIKADILRLQTLKSRLAASLATLEEKHDAFNTCGTGNAAHDVKMLCGEIAKGADTILAASTQIAAAEFERDQRAAEREHGPLISTLREIVLSAAPNVVALHPARQTEGAV